MRFVLDNSVVMRWLFCDGTEEAVTYARRILERLTQDDVMALVPAIWSLEVANVMVRAEAKGLLSEARSAEFLGILKEMNIETDPRTSRHALGDTLQLARRHGLSSYDAAYLELALREGIPIASNDQALRKAMAAAGGQCL